MKEKKIMNSSLKKSCKKLSKTIEKQEERQLNRIDFYTIVQTNTFALFDDSLDGRLIREDEHSCQSKRLLSEINPVDLRIYFLKKEEMMDTIQPHTSPY